MAIRRNATPLIALDAVALDTETTGLDPRSARIVEIGAVRIIGGRLEDPSDAFRSLVRPDESIPASATRIHGIDQAAVVLAPAFAKVWTDLSHYIGDAVIIGHTIGFDLAVLKRECGRIGAAFLVPSVLDVRLLAQIAEPELAGYSLENLAAWLEVDISGRHSALGDATAAARIFCKLIPHLRVRRIRTLGEALRSCRDLADNPAELQRAAWQDIATKPEAGSGKPAVRLDVYPYQHRVAEIMTTPAQSVVPGTSIASALERLMRARISSLFVLPGADSEPLRPERMGIVTERDILRALESNGGAALAWPVERVMSRPLHCISSNAFVHQAMARMNRLKIRHLGVTDLGQVIGALSARDLLRLRAEAAAELGDQIDQGLDVYDLARAWGRLAPVCSALVNEGLGGREVAAVISRELVALTSRAAILAERFMEESGRGGPPCEYVFLALGSIGRGESLLAMDQDHALIYADGTPTHDDGWFETLAKRVSDILHEVGVPYCKGGVMASNPIWRGSVSTWRQRVADWILRSSPHDLLSIDIFFDMQGVHGRIDMAQTLWRHAFEAARGQAAFAKLLIEAGGAVEPARTWFGGLRTAEGRIDLKKAGLFGIVSRARALAVCHYVTERSTAARLDGIKALHIGAESDIDALIDAHGIFLDLILKQQIRDIEDGRPASNSIAVRRLSRRDRQRLDFALRSVEHLDGLTHDLLFKT
jgi:DNA polymerase-3 subunit epsilon/CBS domain-containing protein